MFIQHVKTLATEDLAKQVRKEQVENDWSGLAREANEICAELGIVNINTTDVNTKEWKRNVKVACKDKDKKDMAQEMQGKSKLEGLLEDLEAKEYFKYKSLSKVQEIFRVRTQMLEGFKDNFKNRTQTWIVWVASRL